MTGSKRVFLGCWVSLDEQDRLCEVTLDKSAIEEVSRNASGQGHSIVNFPVRNAGGRSARLSIYTDTPI
jgi:hypothetical protein